MIACLTRRVARAYPRPLTRLYVRLRFLIINRRMLAALMQHIPAEGVLVNLGCGFGLFDLFFALAYPHKRIFGCDLSRTRIESARAARDRLGLRNSDFDVQDLCAPEVPIPACDQILVLDILHHLPPEAQNRLIAKAAEALRPGGRLVVKDIHRGAPFRLAFTWLLDKLMTRGEPTHYFSEESLRKRLQEAGFTVEMLRLPSLLPFPHVLAVAVRRE